MTCHDRRVALFSKKRIPDVLINVSKWWGWQDLNLRPIGYEPTALTPELQPRAVEFANVQRKASYYNKTK